MDARELFEDQPHLRSDVFMRIYEAIESMTEEQKEKLVTDLLENNPEIAKDLEPITIIFQAYADQMRQEKTYNKEVLEPAFKKFNELTPAIHIRGLEL